MQTTVPVNAPKNCSSPTFSVFFIIIIAVLFFDCTSAAQVKPLNDLRTATKKVNIAIGSPIDNDNTRKILAVIDRQTKVNMVIDRYNLRFGNDSVRAKKFVDREPDEKAPDPLLRDFYNVVVESDSSHQESLWYTFLVKKDFSEVKNYDVKKSKTVGFNDWMKKWPATEFLSHEEREE